MYVGQKLHIMDLIGAWKHKLDEAMAVFRDMSQLAKLEAVSYWKDAEAHMFNCDKNLSNLVKGQQQTLPTEVQNQPQGTFCNFSPEKSIDIDTSDLLPTLISEVGDILKDSVPILMAQDNTTTIYNSQRDSPLENHHDTTNTSDNPTLGPRLILQGEPIQKQWVDSHSSSTFCLSSSQARHLDNLYEQDYMNTVSNSPQASSPYLSDSLETIETPLDQSSYAPSFGDNTLILDDSNFDAIPDTSQLHDDHSLSRSNKVTKMDDVEVMNFSAPFGTIPNEANIPDATKNDSIKLQQVYIPPSMSTQESENYQVVNLDYAGRQYDQYGHLTQTITDYPLPRPLFNSQESSSGELLTKNDLASTAIPQSSLHTCDICGKSGFASKGNLKRHRDTHSGEKPYKCDFCSASFTEKKNLKIHLRRHSGEKPYKCDICHAAFAQLVVLKSHMTTHLTERRFPCTRCDQSFKLKSALRRHTMRHEGVKNFHCSSCQAAFYFKTDLNKHMRTHTDERPYACDLCDKRFKRRQLLNEHRNRHFGAAPYSCKCCRKSFPDLSALCKHIKQHKEDEVSRQSILTY